MATRYYSAEISKADDFQIPYTGKTGEVVYDAKTRSGPWATMKQESWEKHGSGRLGTGHGQKYVRNEQGQFIKVEG